MQEDSARQFASASRSDLAEKELKEVELLATFLPPLISQEDMDVILKECLSASPVSPSDSPGKSKGRIFKAFNEKVDKTLVDTALLKRRVDALFSQQATSI